jgi:hypothetical protein
MVMGPAPSSAKHSNCVLLANVAFMPGCEVATRTIVGARNSEELLGVAFSEALRSVPETNAGLRSIRPRTPCTSTKSPTAGTIPPARLTVMIQPPPPAFDTEVMVAFVPTAKMPDFNNAIPLVVSLSHGALMKRYCTELATVVAVFVAVMRTEPITSARASLVTNVGVDVIW